MGENNTTTQDKDFEQNKVRRSVTIPEELDKKIRERNINFSGLVTDMVSELFADSETAEGDDL